MSVDTSTLERPGEIRAVQTLDGESITRADRFICVSLAVMLQFHVPGTTDIELGTEGHGLGLVRYRSVRRVNDQVYLYERVDVDAGS